MNKAVFAGLAAALSLSAVNAAYAEGDAAKGKEAYAVCLACHGPDGSGHKELGAPNIAVLPGWYITRQLGNFKAGIRGADAKDTFGTQMRPMAMTLADDAAVANVVAYIGTLDGAKPAATIEGDADAGKAAYATCAACHGPDGSGNEALNAPPLKGLQDWYIKRQLAYYKAGLRGTHEQDTYGMQMRPMSMMLADETALDNVAAYIATLE